LIADKNRVLAQGIATIRALPVDDKEFIQRYVDVLVDVKTTQRMRSGLMSVDLSAFKEEVRNRGLAELARDNARAVERKLRREIAGYKAYEMERQLQSPRLRRLGRATPEGLRYLLYAATTISIADVTHD